jgi:hypothetical protein
VTFQYRCALCGAWLENIANLGKVLRMKDRRRMMPAMLVHCPGHDRRNGAPGLCRGPGDLVRGVIPPGQPG